MSGARIGLVWDEGCVDTRLPEAIPIPRLRVTWVMNVVVPVLLWLALGFAEIRGRGGPIIKFSGVLLGLELMETFYELGGVCYVGVCHG